jgi:hypothetical protein
MNNIVAIAIVIFSFMLGYFIGRECQYDDTFDEELLALLNEKCKQK